MSQPFIGEICCFGFNFAPRGWAQCNGQIMSIAQNQPLYVIIGTTYGGDGQTTYRLPDMQGRIPMHWGTGRNGQVTVIGEAFGTTNITLTSMNLPRHNHTINAAAPTAIEQRTAEPTANSFFSQIKGALLYLTNPSALDTSFSPQAITTYGSSAPHDNMQPYLALNFCIALYGVFPTRN